MPRLTIDQSIEERYYCLLDLDNEFETSEDADDKAYYDNVRAYVVDTELKELAGESAAYWIMTGEGPC